MNLVKVSHGHSISSAEEDLALGIMESNLRGVKFLS